MKIRRLLIALTLLAGGMAAFTCAQDETFPASFSHFQFNFFNPGGRATAMGGAFIAQGNDATGSETNPAGLLFIPKPMLFGEYRYFRHAATRAFTATDTEIVNKTFVDTVNSPTFLSFVYPTGKWAFAVYRQELANFVANFANEDFFVPGTGHENWIINRQSIFLDFKLVNYGFTVARRLHETFAVGFSVRAAQLDFSSHELVNLDRERERPAGFPDLQANTDPPDGIGRYVLLDDSDMQVSFVAGFQWKPNDIVSLAGVYRYGETHKLKTVFYDNVIQTNLPPDQRVLRKEYDAFEINVPDRFGFGTSITPNDKWTFNLDMVRVQYTDLNEQFLDVLSPDVRQYFGWENGTEIRAGAEYLVPIGTTNSIAFRGGYYRAPDPTIHYLGGADTTPGHIGLDFLILFPPLGTVHHGTFGLGFVIHRNFQVDLAGDLSKDKDYFALSLMYNFGS